MRTLDKALKYTILILLTYLSTLLLTACGIQKPPMQDSQIENALRPYLNEFLSQGRLHSVNLDASHLTMTFSESMPSTAIPGAYVLAYCQRTSIGQNIIVKGSFWNAMSVSEREQVIFHELGHCLLGLEHDNGIERAIDYNGGGSYWDYAPSSIMNELQFSSLQYSGNRSTYLNRLFGFATIVPLFWNGPSQVNTSIYN